MKRSLVSILFLFLCMFTFAQKKSDVSVYELPVHPPFEASQLQKPSVDLRRASSGTPSDFSLQAVKSADATLIHDFKASGLLSSALIPLPEIMEGTCSGSRAVDEGVLLEELFLFLDEKLKPWRRETPTKELFGIVQEERDELGILHIRLQQEWKAYPVFGSQYIAHLHPNGKLIVNGRVEAFPDAEAVTPVVSPTQAIEIVINHLTLAGISSVALEPQWMELIGGEQNTVKLEWYKKEDMKRFPLCYHVTSIPNLANKWEYFIDAQSGEVIDFFQGMSEVAGYLPAEVRVGLARADYAPEPSGSVEWFNNGPAVANAVDFFGTTRTINTFNINNLFYLVDGSRQMYVPGSLPSNPRGALVTMDCNGTSPDNFFFNPTYYTSQNNTWTNRRAVSTHYNTMLVYDFFRNTLNRNSYDNRGGTMFSFVDIPDPGGLPADNAFWMHKYSFYGAGAQLFIRPLGTALDVVAHEYGHGLVQETANLVYRNEPGSLNEMFADLTAVFTNNNTWQIGGNVVNSQIFQSGLLRNLANPANGGSGLHDPGWQPGHVNQQYRGPENNGGVHINSSIPGNAMFRFAQRTSQNTARNVAFRALIHYLTQNSQFVDFRIAAIQAALDLHGEGQIVQALRQSFDEVGIVGSTGGSHEPDLEINPGEDFVLAIDNDSDLLFLTNGNGEDLLYPLSSKKSKSIPSISDDGSAIVFVGEDKKMHLISINHSNGNIEEIVLQDEAIWRNVALSKDGSLLAALTDELNNMIYVYSFERQSWRAYELHGVSTDPNRPILNNVFFADAIVWSHDGSTLMYDALNAVAQNRQAWDIGLIEVWNSSSNNFAGGTIVKLFQGLDPGISIGNPVFAQTAPHIIAFDYVDDGENFALFAMNLERGDLELVFNNLVLGYPCFSKDDTRIIFDAQSTEGVPVIASQRMSSNRIQPSGSPQIFIPRAYWGVWFSNGNRDLSTATVESSLVALHLDVFPNPTSDWVYLQWQLARELSSVARIELMNLNGDILQVWDRNIIAESTHAISLTAYPSGVYFVRLLTAEGQVVKKVVKK